MNLENFFNPKSIAVVGASADRKKLGNQILRNLISNGYKGRVYPINLSDSRIEDLKAYQSVAAVKKPIDLAVIVIPSKLVFDAVSQCNEAKIKNLVIITAGFSEDGPQGAAIEKKIADFAEKNGMNILGPNCLGYINTASNLNVTFAKSKNKVGRVAFLSQSGAICSSALDWVQTKPVGFSKFISLGNQAVLTENDFFEYFIKDSKTDLVIAYLEEIADGRKFMSVVSRLAKIKPVAILKAGMSKEGAEAAMSHTGSMAGSNEAVLAGLKRSGAIILHTIEDMFNLMLLYEKKDRKNSDLFMVSNAGGPLVATVDFASSIGLSIGKLSRTTARELSKKLPPIVKIKNPMDIIGDADAARYQAALETIAKDPNVNNIFVMLTPQSSTEIEKTAQVLVAISKKYKNKNIFCSFICGESINRTKKILDDNKVINFEFPNNALEAYKLIADYDEGRKKLKPYLYHAKHMATADKILEQMDYLDSIRLLEKYEIPVVDTRRIYNSNRDTIHLQFPIAMKVVGKDLIHKTEKNAIALNIKDAYEANIVCNQFSDLLDAEGNYVVAQPMIKGQEMIIGFRRDRGFGPIIMVGLGGIYTEVFKDVALEVDDLDEKRALEMIKSLKMYPILAGARGKGGYDIDALVRLVINVSRLARENAQINELDINPLFMTDKGPIAADVRVII